MIGSLKSKSLRFWVALGMVIALIPLLVSALGGYLLLNTGVIAPFKDVALRQRYEINPVQRLRLLMWETLPPVDEFMDGRNYSAAQAYRNQREKIDLEFATLADALKGDTATEALMERARVDWSASDRIATELLSETAPVASAASDQNLRLFHEKVEAANDELTAVYERLNADLEDDHDVAALSYERSMWVTGIAAALSLLSIFLGVYVIGRILASSVDRLVTGASRFAEGDRNHRIEIALPPELHRVAEEFNQMIVRIHESEQALSTLAHEDSLTQLGNRRAFDEAFAEVRARYQRQGEAAALLAVDIDYFKRINDKYGHAAGDQVLRLVADAMVRNKRPFDKVFRIGGEEFVVILPGVDDDKAGDVAERLREAIASTPFSCGDDTINISVSIGVATTTQTCDQAELMEAADAALYRAKGAGRNRVIVNSSILGESRAGKKQIAAKRH